MSYHAREETTCALNYIGGVGKRLSSLNPLVIDLETTMRNKGEYAVGDQVASPKALDNKIVLYGAKNTSSFPYIYCSSSTLFLKELAMLLDNSERGTAMLVGHNIKFDLLYLLRDHKEEMDAFFNHGGMIWDTQIVEYLISGQRTMFAPLGDKRNKDGKVVKQGLYRKYGGEDKLDKIGEYWAAGIDTDEIPTGELVKYLKGDLDNTQRIYLGQLEYIRKNMEMKNLVFIQMNALVATTYMEYHGMYFDMDCACEDGKEVEEALKKAEKDLQNQMWLRFREDNETCYPIDAESVKPTSNQQVSVFLFGGDFKFIASAVKTNPEDGTPLVYKTGLKKGLIKTRKETFIVKVRRTVIPYEDSATATGHYQVGDAALARYTSLGKTVETFLGTLLKYRKLYKDFHTYYVGLLNLTWAQTSTIHGSLLHCSTATGRLSSSKPNLQNITSSD